MGDGVLAYFGYPQAHEHDAERAVQAGLALVEAVPKLKTAAGVPLQVRVGIATGLVVVGDLIGSGEAQERGIVGETPNLAARLQALAEPNMVVIAEGTRRLLGDLFELQDLGAKDVKGIAGPVRAWAALRASSVESRFDALHTTGLTALVGREEEFELLLRRWSQAKTGQGQVVLLSGEAGIGKSRLTAALLERLAGEPHTRLRYFCSPQHTDSALYPIIGQMERAAGLSRHDAPQARLDKLDVVLAQTSTSMQDAALFAEMLSLANDGRYPALESDPATASAENAGSVDVATRGTRAPAPSADDHGGCPLGRPDEPGSVRPDGGPNQNSSGSADRNVPPRVQRPVGWTVACDEPDAEPAWGARSGRHQSPGWSGTRTLPADVMAEIVERTDGIPLFVEEMTKAVLEAQGEGEARRTVAMIPSPALSVPASLHASLMARLDRLGSAKELAQIGATIGREFSYALLSCGGA